VLALSLAHMQSRIAKFVGVLVLVACEAATFIATANLQLISIEDRAAPLHEAAAKRKAAEEWLARLDRDDRVQRAEAELREARADANAKSTAPDCGKGCIATLAKTVDDATAAVGDARQSLYIETRQARAALDKAPLPPPANALADHLHVEAATLDLWFVGFRGFAVAAGAAVALAFGAFGWQRPKTAFAEPIPSQVIAPAKRGSVGVFMSDKLTRVEGEKTGAALLFTAYLDWCHARDCEPLDVGTFNARLQTICQSVGIRRRGEQLCNVKLAS
jgi:hypothetical protein